MRVRVPVVLSFLLCLVTVAGTASTAASPDVPVPVAHAGFEAAGADLLPQGWALVGLPRAGTVARRVAPGHGGEAALELATTVPASLAVASEPVRLRVGQLYRLSVWVRTDDAVSDPLARYPTAVPAALTMASFPFTNHSP